MNNTLNNGFKVLEYLAASGKNCSVPAENAKKTEKSRKRA